MNVPLGGAVVGRFEESWECRKLEAGLETDFKVLHSKFESSFSLILTFLEKVKRHKNDHRELFVLAFSLFDVNCDDTLLIQSCLWLCECLEQSRIC